MSSHLLRINAVIIVVKAAAIIGSIPGQRVGSMTWLPWTQTSFMSSLQTAMWMVSAVIIPMVKLTTPPGYPWMAAKRDPILTPVTLEPCLNPSILIKAILPASISICRPVTSMKTAAGQDQIWSMVLNWKIGRLTWWWSGTQKIQWVKRRSIGTTPIITFKTIATPLWITRNMLILSGATCPICPWPLQTCWPLALQITVRNWIGRTMPTMKTDIIYIRMVSVLQVCPQVLPMQRWRTSHRSLIMNMPWAVTMLRVNHHPPHIHFQPLLVETVLSPTLWKISRLVREVVILKAVSRWEVGNGMPIRLVILPWGPHVVGQKVLL